MKELPVNRNKRKNYKIKINKINRQESKKKRRQNKVRKLYSKINMELVKSIKKILPFRIKKNHLKLLSHLLNN